MKKIIAFVGSLQGERSRTYRYVEYTIKQIAKQHKELIYHIISANDVNIHPCIGCKRCFVENECWQDKKDDLPYIKNELLDADFVIFASPVYAHNITGSMKTFIDRVSYWAHTMRLAGKLGMVIATASSNGCEPVIEYLDKILSHMGVNVIASASIFVQEIDQKVYLKEVGKKLDEEICNIINALACPTAIVNENLERIFQSRSKMFKFYQENNYRTKELLYWEEKGFFECENFIEMIHKMGKLQNK